MILNENYVLVNEICKEHGVAMSNFSPLASDDMLIESDAVIKRGGTTVIDKYSTLLPQYIQELALNTSATDLTGMIMVSELKDDYYLSNKHIEKIGDIVTIQDKKFVKVSEDLLPVFGNPKWTIYPVSSEEIEDDYMQDIIDKKQFKQLDKNTFLTWY